MEVSVYDPYVQANVIEDRAATARCPTSRRSCPETDVLTVHMPLAAESRAPDRKRRARSAARPRPGDQLPRAAASSMRMRSTTR